MSSPPTFGRRGVQAPATPAAVFRPAAPVPQMDTPWGRSPPASEAFPSNNFAVLGRLFSFEGRFSRQQYWRVRVCAIVALRVDALMARSVGTNMQSARAMHAVTPSLLATGLMNLLLLLAVVFVALWVGLAAAVKRWHDRDKAWTWALLGFVPIVGWFWQFAECGFAEGTPGPNRFGPDPKGASSAAYRDKLAETFS